MPAESAFKVLADHLPGLHWLADADGAPVWVSREWEHRDALIAEGWQAVFAPDAVARLMGDNQDAYELTAGSHHGASLRLHVDPIRDASGAITGWAGRAEAAGRGTSLGLSDRLRHESDPAVIMAIANRALGEHLGALRVG